MRTNYCGLIDKSYLGQTVTLCGWVRDGRATVYTHPERVLRSPV